jgi:hypothetical protein
MDAPIVLDHVRQTLAPLHVTTVGFHWLGSDGLPFPEAVGGAAHPDHTV